MDATTISAIAEVVDAIPGGPYATFESPLPAFEQIAGRDVNMGSSFGEINLPFGQDFLDVSVTDDNSTHVEDILDVNVSGADVAGA